MSFSRVVTEGTAFTGGGVSLPDRKMVSFAPQAAADTIVTAMIVKIHLCDLRELLCKIVIVVLVRHKSFNTQTALTAISRPPNFRISGLTPANSTEMRNKVRTMFSRQSLNEIQADDTFHRHPKEQ